MLIKLKCYSNEFYTRNNKTNVLKTDIMAKDLIDMFLKRIQSIWLRVETAIIKKKNCCVEKIPYRIYQK